MYVVKNRIGKEVFYQSQSLKSCWGCIDANGDYVSERSAKAGQIFHFFKNAIAIQLELLEYLERKYSDNKIRIHVPDFEKESFFAVVPVKEFRKIAVGEFGDKAIFNYDKKNFRRYGKQIRVPMHSFAKEYLHQTKLA